MGYNDRTAIAYGWSAQKWLIGRFEASGYLVDEPDRRNPYAAVDVRFPGGLREITVAVKGTLKRGNRLARRAREHASWCDLYVLVTPTADGLADHEVRGFTWGTVFAHEGRWDATFEKPAWVLATTHLRRDRLSSFLRDLAAGRETIPALPDVPFPPYPYATPRPSVVIPSVAVSAEGQPATSSDRRTPGAPLDPAPSQSEELPASPLAPGEDPGDGPDETPDRGAPHRLEIGADRDPIAAGDPNAVVEVRRRLWREASHRYYLRKHVDQEALW